MLRFGFGGSTNAFSLRRCSSFARGASRSATLCRSRFMSGCRSSAPRQFGFVYGRTRPQLLKRTIPGPGGRSHPFLEPGLFVTCH